MSTGFTRGIYAPYLSCDLSVSRTDDKGLLTVRSKLLSASGEAQKQCVAKCVLGLTVLVYPGLN